MRKTKYLIVGAGPAGLGAGYALEEAGVRDYLIIEKNAYPGGLAASFVDDQGFTWDIGGHVLFSHYEYFNQVMDRMIPAEDWNYITREAWVWMFNRFIPYPFQNNLRYLPRKECIYALGGLIRRKAKEGVLDFESWIRSTFGNGIAELFMLPYNFKVWAYEPKKLNSSWIAERVAVVDSKRALRNFLFDLDDVSWGPNSKFRFPKIGGTGAIWEKVASHLNQSNILLNTELAQIDAEQKRVRLRDGEYLEYEKILSTVPLDILTTYVKDLPSSSVELASELMYSSSNIVGIGVEGALPDELKTKCWMYFPESDCPFYRATVFSNYSKDHVPNPLNQFSLLTETSESVDKEVDQDSLVEETIQGLRNTRLINDSHKIVSRWHYRARHGYPTPSIKRDSILAEVVQALENLGIDTKGRFGAWRYEVSNQDHTFIQGVNWAHQKLGLDPISQS